MAYTHADRLSALDTMFLELEDDNVHMHVGSVSIFESGPLRTPEGGLDIERIQRFIEAQLRESPRFRQRLAWVPLTGHPVWVDDDRFNIHYHVRHSSLPHPGDERQLKRLAGRILSQRLDRRRPLWEMWMVEGLDGDRCALICKIHHCLIDGVSGVDVLAMLLRTDPDPTVPEPHPWIPRPAPSGRELLAREALRRATLPLAGLRTLRRALSDPTHTVETLRETLEGILEATVPALRPASPTPLNTDIGPHRRFDWAAFPLEAVKEVKARLGGTVNDVVLTVVTGALRAFLHERGERVEELKIRALVPVNTRRPEEHGRLGNRVSFLLVPLPVDEADPRRRLARITEATRELKGSKMAEGAELLEEISDWTTSGLFVTLARLAARARAYNLVVTNVPGPQFPAYLLGARMEAIYPVVPLFEGQGLGIALFSYDGGLFWGFHADWDALPDLHDLVEAAQTEFERLRKLAAEAPARSGRSRRPRRPAAD